MKNSSLTSSLFRYDWSKLKIGSRLVTCFNYSISRKYSTTKPLTLTVIFALTVPDLKHLNLRICQCRFMAALILVTFSFPHFPY